MPKMFTIIVIFKGNPRDCNQKISVNFLFLLLIKSIFKYYDEIAMILVLRMMGHWAEKQDQSAPHLKTSLPKSNQCLDMCHP